MSPVCLDFLLLRQAADTAEQELWVALETGTALGCMGNALDLVCIEIDSASPEQGAHCLWRLETFLSSPMSIFCGLI